MCFAKTAEIMFGLSKMKWLSSNCVSKMNGQCQIFSLRRSGRSAPGRAGCLSSPAMTYANNSSRPAGAWSDAWARGLFAESVTEVFCPP